METVLIVAIAVCGVVAAAAVATPGLLVTATTPVRGTIAKPFKAQELVAKIEELLES